MPQRRFLHIFLFVVGFFGCLIVFKGDRLSTLHRYVDDPEVRRGRLAENKWQPTIGRRCGGELMQFPSYKEGTLIQLGAFFGCDAVDQLKEWRLDKDSHYDQLPVQADDVVFVNYASSNHFPEARKGISEIRSRFKHHKIVFYDIGLSPSDRAELSGVCNLELRLFNFSLFPPFVRNLAAYHFKPIIAAEVFSEFKAFWLIDSSIRFKVDPDEVYEMVNNRTYEPYVTGHSSGHSVFAATHSSTYNFLPIDSDLSKSNLMHEATAFIVQSDFSREAVKWYSLCALTKECLAPSEALLFCHFKKGDSYKTFANCHRYDQSAINLVLTSLRERREDWEEWRTKDRVPFQRLGGPDRGSALPGPLKIQCPTA